MLKLPKIALLTILVACLSVSFTFADVGEEHRQKRLEVTEVVKQFVQAWNQDDATTLSMLFSPDGVLSGTGTTAENPSDIEMFLTEERPDIFLGTDLNDQGMRIRFPKPDFAIVNGQYELSGIKVLLGFTTTVHGTFNFLLEKQHGSWRINHASIKRAP